MQLITYFYIWLVWHTFFKECLGVLALKTFTKTLKDRATCSASALRIPFSDRKCRRSALQTTR